MKKISTIVMIFLIALSTFSILAPRVKATDELWTSSAPIDYTPIVPDEINGSATALLIEDVLPWSYDSDALALSQLGISYDLKHSWSLQSVNLAEYKFIILASDQPTSTYVNIANNIAKIESYVSNGGIYVAHACDEGWSGGDWTGCKILPGDVTHANYYHGGYYSQFIEVVDPSSPIVAGLDSAYFQGWGYSTHGWFTNVPYGTNIVMDTGSGKPTYIIYSYGAGKVLATMQTIEWGYSPHCWTGWHGQFLLNELSYANTYARVRRFDPLTDGFQFSNDDFTEKIIMSLEEIKEEFESSPLSNEIPSTYWVLFELLIRGLISAQKGYCGGMVFTAKQYFENPSQLPSGYSCTYDTHHGCNNDGKGNLQSMDHPSL